MNLCTYTDQFGVAHVTKVPLVASDADVKDVITSLVSGENGLFFSETNKTVLDSSELVKGNVYNCVQVTCTDSGNSRASFPFIISVSDAGKFEQKCSDALMGLDMLGDGSNNTVTRVTMTVVATFIA
jgi:hypothetical protein